MRTLFGAILSLLVSASLVAAQNRATGALEIYFIDTEGGQATLYVSPTGESVLVDAGNPGERDAERIAVTLRQAGVTRLDFLLLTHYHVDHIGGVQELARRIPIGTYVDHGPSVEPNEQVAGFQAAYAALHASARRIIAKPGDRLPLTGMDWRIVTSAGQVLQSPLPGAGAPNPTCAGFTPMNITRDLDNGQSVGSLVSYGEFSTLNLGDLLWNVEFDLMCPVNRVGTVDLYLTSHHGLGQSGSPTLVHPLRPRVAIMNNGTRKGGALATFQTLEASPGLEDLWQLHWSHNVGIEHNAPGIFIANIDDPATLALVLNPPPAQPGGQGGGGGGGGGQGGAAPGGAVTPPPGGAPAPTAGQTAPAPQRATPHTGPAHMLHVTARNDGSFTITNTRNGFSRTYAAN